MNIHRCESAERKKLLENLKNFATKLFIKLSSMFSQGYMVLKGPILNICAEMYDSV